MPHKHVDETPLDIESITPEGVIKRRRGDTITITVSINGAKQDDLVVDLWGGHDTATKTPERFEHKGEGRYEVRKTLDETGEHNYWVRFRHDETRWVWSTQRDEPAITVHVDPAYTRLSQGRSATFETTFTG